MSFYLDLLWHVWISGFFITLALLFIKPYWFMSAEDWEEMYDEQRRENPTTTEAEITFVSILTNFFFAIFWPITLAAWILDRWRP